MKSIGTIKVSEINDNDDGSATIVFEISDEFKESLVHAMGWDCWSQEKFNKFVHDALINYADSLEENDGR
jgi:hypothetical protein